MFHKVRKVHVLPNYKLSVTFFEGVTKIYDVIPLILKSDKFAVLKKKLEIFNTVEVDVGGYGIFWRDDLDISCDELWANGCEITE